MPKIKTNRSASKRFKMTGSGRIKRYRAGKSHLLSSKSRKRKRILRQETTVDSANIKRIKRLLPNG